jgi:hypothetical protein
MSEGGFISIPHSVMASNNFIKLSSNGVKLLVDLGFQFRGNNNGDLCATWSMMEKRGWKSRSTLHKSLNELLHYRFIVKTRQGGQHAASLYALTWKKIDECGGKLEMRPTEAPLAYWMVEQPMFDPHESRKRNSYREHIDTYNEGIYVKNQ